jgi:uncharacterized BrkB/YihY/UPF0761 family membrane protein
MTEPKTLDLTTESPEMDELDILPERPYRREAEPGEDRRERTRSYIALGLIVTLGFILLATTVFTFLLIFRLPEVTPDDLVTLLQGIGSALLTPLVGLIGAFTGFYYGGQRAAQTDARLGEGSRTGGSR